MNKGIMKKMSSWTQLFFLGLFVFGGLILAILIIAITSGGNVNELQSVNYMRVMQIFQAACLFLLPALLCAYIFHDSLPKYLKIDKPIDLKFLFYSLLLILVIQPFISFTGYYNSLLTLPESLSHVERWMREMENSSMELMEKMLITDSIPILFLNIFVIAIMAGITEEFFFRGSLQQIIKKISDNRHLSVWVTAIIFSAIHFQFYGFVPRVILGAVLGYLFLWSGNLWISVIAHAFNNLLSILIFHFFYGTPQYEFAESFGATKDTILYTIASFILSTSMLYLLSKTYKQNKIKDSFSI